MPRFALLLLLTLLCWTPVHAADLGLYADGGWGHGEIDHNSTDFDTDVDVRQFGGGFALSTNTFATTSAPTYRLRVGYDRLWLKDQYDVQIISDGLRIDNAILMPLARGDRARLVLGPLFRVGYYTGKSDGAINGTVAKTRVSAFGIGPELGLNLKLSDDVGLGFSAGYLFNFFAGRIRGNFPSDDYHGHRYNAFAGAALYF